MNKKLLQLAILALVNSVVSLSHSFDTIRLGLAWMSCISSFLYLWLRAGGSIEFRVKMIVL